MLVTLLMVGCLISAPPETAPDELPSRVRTLIRRLDAPRLDDREAAEKELTDQGPVILRLLPEDTAQLSAEVQLRLGRVRQVLEQKLADAAVETSRVTIEIGRASCRERVLERV